MSKIKGQREQRVMPAIRRGGSRAKAVVQKVNTTLGELIAAAFDTVGSTGKVTKVISSPNMSLAMGKRIIFV